MKLLKKFVTVDCLILYYVIMTLIKNLLLEQTPLLKVLGLSSYRWRKTNWNTRICCVSRTLSPPERNYSVTDLEGLAINYAIQKFRQYIISNK